MALRGPKASFRTCLLGGVYDNLYSLGMLKIPIPLLMNYKSQQARRNEIPIRGLRAYLCVVAV